MGPKNWSNIRKKKTKHIQLRAIRRSQRKPRLKQEAAGSERGFQQNEGFDELETFLVFKILENLRKIKEELNKQRCPWFRRLNIIKTSPNQPQDSKQSQSKPQPARWGNE